jgi:adhesin/invasin
VVYLLHKWGGMTESPRPQPLLPIAGRRTRSPWRRVVTAMLLIVATIAMACSGEPTAPAEPVVGTLRLRSLFAEGESPAELRLTIDSVRVVLTRPGVTTPVVDARAAFSEGATLSWVLELARADEPLSALVELRSGSELLYSATAIVTAAPAVPGGLDAREVTVRYVGPPRAMAIVFSPDTAVLRARGESRAIGATALNRAGQPLPGKSFIWTSSAPEVATVDAAGHVTAVAEGTARITASVDGLERNAMVTVAVVASAERSTLDVTPASQPADGASAASLLVTLRDANGNPTGTSGGTLALTSSIGTLSEVADHGDGTYTATLTSTTIGMAVVHATLAGASLSDSAAVEFTRPPSVITSLEVSPSAFTLAAIGSTRPFLATVRDQFGEAMPAVAVTWSSSAPAVATVHATSGLVTAVANGNAEITATVTDAPGLSASRAVTVHAEAAPSRTTLVAAPATAIADGTETIAITVRLFDALDHALVTGGDAVALVSTRGTVSGVVDHGDGSYTASLTSTDVGAAIVRVSVNGTETPAQAAIEFLPIPRVLTRVELTPLDARFTALGAARAFTAIARDQFDDAMTAIAFTWSSSASAVSVDGAATTASVLVTAVANGVATITATPSGAPALAAQVVVTVEQAPSATRSTITADPASRIADATSAATVQVTLIDSLGTALGHSAGPVVMETDHGTLSAVTDQGNGRFSAMITAASPGLATITARVGELVLTASTSVTFIPIPRVPATVEIVALATPLDALGATASFSATVRDQFGDLLPGALVSWASTDAAVATIDEASGLATAVTNGSTTIRVTVAGAPAITASVPLAVTQRASRTRSTIAASRDTIINDGTTASTLEVTLRDRLGARLATGGSAVAMATSAGTLSSVTDLGDGRYQASLTSTTVALATISATVGGEPLDSTATVRILRVPSVATTVEIVSGPATLDAIGADGAFSALARDQFGEVMPSAGVTWQSAAPGVATVDAASGLVTAIANGATTITVRVTGAAGVTASAPLTVAQRASTSRSTLAVSRDTIIADGTTAATVTLTLHDRLGVRLASGGSAVALATSAGTLSDATDLADGRYTAALTASAVGEAVVNATVDGAPLTTTVRVIIARIPPFPASVGIVTADEPLDALGATRTLAAVVRDQYGDAIAGAPLAWESAAPAVATIDAASGMVTAVANGATTITVRVPGAASLTASVPLTVAQRASTSRSSLAVSHDSIIADGTDAATLTLTLRDRLGAPLSTGGTAVTMATTAGTLGAVADQGNGTYRASFTSTTVAVATISAAIAGAPVDGAVTVTVTRVPPAPTSIEIVSGPASFDALGATGVFAALVRDQYGDVMPGATVRWTSSEPAVAAIDAEGALATAIANGTTTISANVLAAPGVTASLALTVAQRASAERSSFAASRDSIIADGTTASTISLTLRDRLGAAYAAGGAVAFTTSAGDLSAVTDLDDGRFTATFTSTVIARATITATLDGAAVTGPVSVVITRIPPVVASVVITPEPGTLRALGATRSYTAVAYEADGQEIPGVAFTWGTDAPTVASIDAAGIATTVGNGTATITATAPNGVAGSSSLVVAQHAVTMTQAASCTHGAPQCVLAAFGDSVTLTTVVRDSLEQVIVGAPVNFTSSDPAVATVTADGVVIAVGNGSAVITAEFEGLTTTYTAVVRQKVTFIKLTPIELWLSGVGASGTVTATPMDRTGHAVDDVGVTWDITDPAMATAEVTGARTVRVTSLMLGETKLYAHSDGVSFKIIVRIR